MSSQKNKSVSVVGLGRVGLITLFHLAEKGWKVYGIDINEKLIKQFKNKKQPFKEPQFNELLKKHHKKVKFLIKAPQTPYHFICVPTPLRNKAQKMDLSFVKKALKKIKKSPIKKYVFIRSTLTPGTCKKLSREFKHLSICYVPEFFREGCFVEDYKTNTLSVMGCQNPENISHFTYFQFSKNTTFCSWEEAEILKLACNLFHGLKVSFANEIGRVAKNFNASPHKIMNVFLKDKVLNISKKYLKPGLSYGGPCLSKDIQSLHAIQGEKNVQWLLPQTSEASNKLHTQWIAKQILKCVSDCSKPKIGLLGCSFTGNPTEDFRQSPVLKLVEILLKNKNINLYGIEKPLNQYKCQIPPEKFFTQFKKYDMCLLGGWNTFLKTSLFADYKGIVFDLLIQNLPAYIKEHPNYKTAFS